MPSSAHNTLTPYLRHEGEQAVGQLGLGDPHGGHQGHSHLEPLGWKRGQQVCRQLEENPRVKFGSLVNARMRLCFTAFLCRFLADLSLTIL